MISLNIISETPKINIVEPQKVVLNIVPSTSNIDINPVKLNIVPSNFNIDVNPVTLNIVESSDTKKNIKFPPIKKYTLEIFLERAKIVHGDRYDYSLIRSDMIKNSSSKVPVICNMCNYQWNLTIASHITGTRGCANCSNRLPWSHERFIQRAIEIHGDKYDYSLITSDMIKGQVSKVPMICKTCNYQWSPRINDHINSKSGCPSCAGVLPWTYDKFIQKAKEIHGDKYDYTLITPDMVKNAFSTVPIICKSCNYEWNPRIYGHINSQHGCINCAGKLVWSRERFIQRAIEIHGDKYDYTLITSDMINGNESKVPLICRTCNYQWSPRINDHINSKSGCPNCYGNVPWTYNRFIQKTKEIHGDKYDYTLITSDMILRSESKIPIICRTCGYQWNPTISGHINAENGCPSCAGQVPWTYERFIQRAIEIHGDKYDYTLITNDIINGRGSKVPITCKTCNYRWNTSISCHINGEHGCPNCVGVARWTYERFIQKSFEIHGDKYDYNLILPSMIENCKSKLPIICKVCNYQWNPSLSDHISRRGCPSCSGNLPWTYDRFIQKSKELHGDKYDYTLITNDMIQGKESKVPIICKTCNYQWNPRIDNHINQQNGCPHCRKSKGELACSKVLQSLNIPFITEIVIENLPRKRFDFKFEYNGRKWLLEFDGIQHFEKCDYFHEDEDEFIEKQEIDIMKTKKALEAGYCLIRIDHTQMDNVEEHIHKAINSESNLYVSDVEMYDYILDALK